MMVQFTKINILGRIKQRTRRYRIKTYVLFMYLWLISMKRDSTARRLNGYKFYLNTNMLVYCLYAVLNRGF